jgi:hypothetical protein
MMRKKKILLLLAAAIIVISACSLPDATLPQQAIENTAIAQTVQAASANGNNAGTPSPGISVNTGGGGSNTNSSRPTPTAIPTKPAPTAKSNSSASSVSGNLQIGYVNYFPTNTVYYGNCSGGEDTLVHVESAISPLDDIKEVLLWFDVSDPTGIVYSDYVTMWQLGIGDYAGDIDIDVIGANTMNGNDGSVTFWIEVVDKNNASIHSNAYSVSIWDCSGGVVGQPPGGEPDIRYFLGPASAAAGEAIQLEWEVWDACKVFLDGTEVNASDLSVYFVPSNEGNTTYSHTLTAWGASCDNTTEKYAQVSIAISASGGNSGNSGNNGGNAGGNSVVRFYNNSSHHIVELQIDGQEVILTEAQTILAGNGYLDITVPAGSHTFSAGAGFWSGGIKNAIYPMPGGSFTDQSGSVTIVDPSITQIMTQYSNSSYFGGEYWDQNANIHCAGFNFYSDGSFVFFDDYNQISSGSYTLVQRNPSSYSVVFNVSAGSTQYNGTFYYSGALAGTMYMNNGPAGWEQIEYIYNGGC